MHWRWRERHCAALLLAGLALVPCGPASADEWAIDASTDVRLRHNDNLDNNSGEPKLRADILALSPEVRFSSRTEARELVSSIGLSANRFGGHAERDTVDYHASMSGAWHGELSETGLLASVLRQSSQAEVAQTGIVQPRRQTSTRILQPSLQYQLTETTGLQASYSSTAVRYGGAGGGLVDYNDRSLSAGLNRTLDERLTIGANLSREDFRTLPETTHSLVTAAGATLRWNYSERISLGIDAGRQRTKTDEIVTRYYCIANNSLYRLSDCYQYGVALTPLLIPLHLKDSGRSLNATGNFAFERGDLNLGLSRRLNPNGSGSLVRTDRAEIGYHQRWSETLGQTFAASRLVSHYLDDSAADVYYRTLASGFEWQWERNLVLTAGLSHGEQKSAGSAAVARINEIYLSLNYRWDPVSVSR